jgi:thymidylate synthase
MEYDVIKYIVPVDRSPAYFSARFRFFRRVSSPSGAASSAFPQAARLSLNMRFRSRDAYKAAFMNEFAFIDLGQRLAKKISELRGEEIGLGRFVDQSDSYHLYGSYFKEFGDGFLKLLFEREKMEDRTWTSEFAGPIFEEAREKVKRKVGG